MKVITIDLSVRLPDIKSLDMLSSDFVDYGRVAITPRGMVVSGVMSSHPGNTIHGFYWAIGHNNVLYISPRGCASDIEHLTDSVIRELVWKIGLKSKYDKFAINKILE